MHDTEEENETGAEDEEEQRNLKQIHFIVFFDKYFIHFTSSKSLMGRFCSSSSRKNKFKKDTVAFKYKEEKKPPNENCDIMRQWHRRQLKIE